MLHFRPNLTDIPPLISDHISTDIPPTIHRLNSISSHKLQHFILHSSASSPTVQLPQLLITSNFYVFFPSNSSYSTNSTSLSPPLPPISTSQYVYHFSFLRVIPIRAMASSNVLVQFSGNISPEPQPAAQSTNIDSCWQPGPH